MKIHQINTRGGLILHVVNITSDHIITAGIVRISQRNYLGGMMRGIKPFEYPPLSQGGKPHCSHGYVNSVTVG